MREPITFENRENAQINKTLSEMISQNGAVGEATRRNQSKKNTTKKR